MDVFLWKEKFLQYPLIKDKFLLLTTFLALLINAGIWLLVKYQLGPIAQLRDNGIITVHYDIYASIKIGGYQDVYALAFLGIAILALNSLCGLFFYSKNRILSYYLSFFAFLANIFLLVAVYLLVIFNK